MKKVLIGAVMLIAVASLLGCSSNNSAPTPTATPLLKVVSWNWYVDADGYTVSEGEVQNISGSPLYNIAAVVIYKTADDQLMTYAYAPIDYNPLIAGQTSPFKVVDTTKNPLRAKEVLGFKYITNGTVSAESPAIPTTK